MYTYNCQILRVVDGDTLDLEIDLGFNVRIRERVRLIGVDTPEVFGKNASPEGTVASDFTKAWVEKYTSQDGVFRYNSLKYDSKDKYGRALGTISFIDNTGKTSILNEELLLSGNAKRI